MLQARRDMAGLAAAGRGHVRLGAAGDNVNSTQSLHWREASGMRTRALQQLHEPLRKRRDIAAHA